MSTVGVVLVFAKNKKQNSWQAENVAFYAYFLLNDLLGAAEERSPTPFAGKTKVSDFQDSFDDKQIVGLRIII